MPTNPGHRTGSDSLREDRLNRDPQPMRPFAKGHATFWNDDDRSAAVLIKRHRAAGRYFAAGGLNAFVREEGAGEAVVCIHGVPDSSFVYRKMLPELAARGLHAVAFDLPGQGLTDRPLEFDYSIASLGAWCLDALDQLGIERFHLVMHDFGGPVSLELCKLAPERVKSITILSTPVMPHLWERPWWLKIINARPEVTKLIVRLMPKVVSRAIMRCVGIRDGSSVSDAEIDAAFALARGRDAGRAMVQTIGVWERTTSKSEMYARTLREMPCPVQVIWGDADPIFPADIHGILAACLAGVTLQLIHGARHYVQEDHPVELAERIASLGSCRAAR